MAACNFLVLIILFNSLNFVSALYEGHRICTEEELNSCSIGLYNVIDRYAYWSRDYPCTAASGSLAVARYTLWINTWHLYYLRGTDPSNACGQVNPSTKKSVAVVPTCISGQSMDCSLEEKAEILGQANYSVFITWDDHNCSGNINLRTMSSANKSAFAVIVTEEIGNELLALANNPNYVVDVSIYHNFIGEAVLIALFLFLASCSCCCCIYTITEHLFYRRDMSKEYCCECNKCRRLSFSAVMCITCITVFICLPGFLAWFGACPTLVPFTFTMMVIGVGIFCCWPYIVYRCCCGTCEGTPKFEDKLYECCTCNYNFEDRQSGFCACCDSTSEDQVPFRPNEPVTPLSTYYTQYRPLTNESDKHKEPVLPSARVRPSKADEPDRSNWNKPMPGLVGQVIKVSCTLDCDRPPGKYRIGQGTDERCSVCLGEFTDRDLEEVRELSCQHVCHGGCVEEWLNEHVCHHCKTPITESPPLLGAADEEVNINYAHGASLIEREEEREGEDDTA